MIVQKMVVVVVVAQKMDVAQKMVVAVDEVMVMETEAGSVVVLVRRADPMAVAECKRLQKQGSE